MEIRTRNARPSGGRVGAWKLAWFDVAEKDAKRILDSVQYAHVVDLFDQLATDANPRISESLDIRPIEGFFELRDKGGVLGKINFRAYFYVVDEKGFILVLGCYKKENEGKTPPFIVTKMRNRLRHGIGVFERSSKELP